MFTYFYRIYDKFERPITALAIFTDGDSLFHPNSYHLDFWDTSMIYRFRTFKVKNKKQEYFNKHPNNPFSIILEAVWIELQKGKAIDRSKLKIGITKKLLQSGLPKQKIERLYRFIHYYIRLHSKEEKLIFENSIHPIIKNKLPMGIIEVIEEELKKEPLNKD